ncbi:MAG: hypothetical protein KF784_07215 [Fimbriimonadaceae bacterium]|nr:hypothetical protein [Fimbriimonadaceae bacterium]
MPELPEVETVCRVMRRVLEGKRIKSVEVADDHLVLSKAPKEAYEKALLGRTVTGIGRKGKYWWIELDEPPVVFGHLGMAGWIREIGAHSIRLREHGNAPFEDADGRPRFLKLLLEAEDGGKVVLTDGRRLARLWLGESAEKDKRVKQLGPDMFNEPYTVNALSAVLRKRNAPIKALLLDQKLFTGVGNWIADEVLYHARISPKRLGSELDTKEVKALIDAIAMVLKLAVEVGADSEKYPEDWLFSHRWGGAKGAETIQGQAIVREPVGGRTTAWVPTRQR